MGKKTTINQNTALKVPATASTGEVDSTNATNPFGGRQTSRGLMITLFIIAALILMAPVIATLTSLFPLIAEPDNTTQTHIWATTGPTYLRGTLFLCGAVAFFASVLGCSTAALVSLTNFPGRRVFSFALALPFAVPAYIGAYAYADFFSPFGGFVQMLDAFAPSIDAIKYLPPIRSFWGGVFILSLAVYPYIYLTVRADLASRSSAYIEAARSLGASPLYAFRTILLPGARAAFIGGLALAMMETMADFGVSDYFGIRTLSTGIFRTWYGLGDLTAAAQIAGGLFLIAALLILLEGAQRRGDRAQSSRAHRKTERHTLTPMMQIGALLICTLPIFLGFIVPVILLAIQFFGQPTVSFNGAFLKSGFNSFTISLAGAIIIIIIASLLAYQSRSRHHKILAAIIRLMTIGYAIPGAVIGVGILLAGAKILTPFNINLTSGGIFILLYAYTIRFLTAGYNTAESGLSQIHIHMDQAARNLGAAPSKIIQAIHWPLTRRSLMAGIIIVFIDISRELPATLLLRPFNFETLATHVYRLASDERLVAASPAALLLILMGLIPVALLNLKTQTN